MSKKSKKKYRDVKSIKNKTASVSSQKSDEFNPDYSYVIKDLKRIGILAGTFFILLIVLSFVI